MPARMGAIRHHGFTLLSVIATGALLAASPVGASSPGLAGFAPARDQLQSRVGHGGGTTLEQLHQRRAVSTPLVLPPQSRPYGLSYNDWSVRWWQWAYGLPVAGHPLFDETGADCAAGQSGPVWFLGGVFNVSGTAVRDLCTIPAGKALFFPIINAEWDNFCPPVDPALSIEELTAMVAFFMDLATDLECDLDGQSIQNLQAYRFAADPFAVQMPVDNIWEAFGCPTPAGSYYPLVPEGFFVMLAPPAPGPHTLHFKGTLADPVNFTLEITYHLNVAAPTELESVATMAGRPGTTAPDAVPGARRTSWGRVKAIYR